jgi:hypothetical protein
MTQALRRCATLPALRCALLCSLFCAACGGGAPAPVPLPLPLPSMACATAYEAGYTDRQSYLPGDLVTVHLHGSRQLPACRLDIHDAKGQVALSVASPLPVQAEGQADAAINGFGWRPTLSFPLPPEMASGVYLIEGKSPFVVRRSDAMDVLVVYPSNTANAYAKSGGMSLYTTPKANRVSFLRPIALQPRSAQCLPFFAAMEPLRVGFAADADLEDPATLAQARLLVIAGHSEYWTRTARRNFDRFVDAGGHALVLSGNTMWWQARYSADRTQLICYKGPDPEPNPLLQTISWGDSSLRYPIGASLGADFRRGGYGLKTDAGWDGYRIAAPDSPLLEGTGLRRGDVLRLPNSEYDGAPIRGFDADGFPMLDPGKTPPYRLELIGFDKGSRFDAPTIGTFIVLQRHAGSGTIVNVAGNDWCSDKGMGGRDGDKVRRITRNAVLKLLDGSSVFSPGAAD